MFRHRWLIILAIVLILAIAIFTLTTLLQGRKPATTVSHLSCNAQASSTNPNSSSSANLCQRKILVFSKTAAFRHASIPAAIAALKQLAANHNVAADFTEDASIFNDANLAQYDAVVFLLTTGDVLNDTQQTAFERYIRSGGGYVGVHSATDTEYNWSWYGALVGAYFDRVHGHSRVVQATLDVVDHTQPSTIMLPTHWIRTDEWYNFATNPTDHVHILLTIDERTYQGGVMGPNHPIAWYHDYDGGRAWYTALGHTSESYSEPLFLAHLWGGITYAMGPKPRSTLISPSQQHFALLFRETHNSLFIEQPTSIRLDKFTGKQQVDPSICRSDQSPFVSTTEGRYASPPYLVQGATDSCCTCC